MNVKVVVASANVISLAIGAVAGYFFAKNRLEKQYAEHVEREIEATKKYYRALRKEGEFADPGQVLLTRRPGWNLTEEDEALAKEGIEAAPPERVLHRTLHTLKYGRPNSTPADEIAAEESMRDPRHPYIISEDEFNENDPEHIQNVLTYYQEDDTLADEADEIIDNHEKIVGSKNLERFGHRSNDPTIVYVRNELLAMDYEVHRSEGSYAKEVLDVEPTRK